jgi:hypothetical protein
MTSEKLKGKIQQVKRLCYLPTNVLYNDDRPLGAHMLLFI